MALLSSVAFDFGNGQTLNADRGQRLAHLVELEWLDDGHHDFHGSPFCSAEFRFVPNVTGEPFGCRRSTKVNQTACQLPQVRRLDPFLRKIKHRKPGGTGHRVDSSD
jgi:hypothetical protein